MSRFDAVFLHGVLDYRKSASMPEVPDFKSLQRRLVEAQNQADRLEDGDDLASEISGIASDFDFDEDLANYVDASEDKIQSLHNTVRDVFWKLEKTDLESLTRDEMIDLLGTVHNDLLNGACPDHKSFRDMMRAMWVSYPTSSSLQSFPFFNTLWMNPTWDDHYCGTVTGFKERGPLKVDMYARGSLRMELVWTPATLIFTSDEKIGLFDGVKDNKTFVMAIRDFREYFVDWLRPTEEEIALFDVLHPGADWQVLRYLRDYDAKLSAKVEEPTRIVSVCTTL